MTESRSKQSATLKERLNRADPKLTVPASLAVAELPPGVPIAHVQQGSLAGAAGIVKGEKLVSINGELIRDTIDFYFHGADEELEIELEGDDGKRRMLNIVKGSPEEFLGIELEQFTTQHCGCNCVFCFVHQLPDNMRKSLYIKDEDYRLSFLQGSYITGITLKDSDLERIARQRLTPLYISVHAIDDELRKWLLGIKRCRPMIELLDFFRDNRLQIHTQIVLTPGHNDGAELERTLRTLISYHPAVQSIAIVPLGMTKWREGLPDLRPVDRSYARSFLAFVQPIVKEVEEEFGEPFVMLSDEWYLIAGRKAPSYSKFPEIPQLENGVGMVYHFYRDFADAKRLLPARIERPWKVAAITSMLSPPVLERVVSLCNSCENLQVDVLPTINTVFGESIHVTGLLTGQDLRKTILAKPDYDQYLLPGNCLRKWDERFLDDLTLGQLRGQTRQLLTPVLGGAFDFVATILENATGGPIIRANRHPLQKSTHWSNS